MKIKKRMKNLKKKKKKGGGCSNIIFDILMRQT